MPDIRAGNTQVHGTIASGTTDQDNPLKIGGKASSSLPSAVSNGQRVDAYFDLNGNQGIHDGGTSLTVDNAGTFAVQDSQVIVDNAAFTDGTTKLFASGYVYDEIAGTALTENDLAAARVNVNRAQVQVIEDGTTRGRYAVVTSSNALKVDGSAATQPVSGTVAFSNTTIAVTNAGTFAVQDSQKLIDNAGFTDGTTPVNPVGYVFDDVAGTALTENDIAAARIDSKRAQVSVIEDATTRGRKATVNANGGLNVQLANSSGTELGTVAAPVQVLQTASTATVTAVASSVTSVTLLSSNTSRKGATIYNDSTQIVYVKFGTTAASTDFTVKIPPDSYYEVPMPCYTGRIDAIWASANGNARITELT